MKPFRSFDPFPDPVPQRRRFGSGGLFAGKWMKDGLRIVYADSDGGRATLFTYHAETEERARLVDPDKLKLPDGRAIGLAGHQWSSDESSLLLSDSPNRRGASQGNLYLFTLAGQTLRQLTNVKEPQRNAKLSPDGKRVGLVRSDDLWVLDIRTGREKRLTKTATPTRYNGRFGWVYEEELDLVDGWQWSPDGKNIAYWQVDESQVPQVNSMNYDDLHMKPVETRYPKSGDPNPIVKIGFVSSEGGATHWADLGEDPDIYVARIQWTPKGEGLLIMRLPRLQNRIDLLLANPHTGKVRTVLSDEDKAWLDVPPDPRFLPDNRHFLWHSDRDGFDHVYLFDLEGALVRQVTKGPWDVTAVAHLDATHRVVYFTAARPNPLERRLFQVSLDGGVEAELTPERGTHEVNFSPASNYYLARRSNLNLGPDLALCKITGFRQKIISTSPPVTPNQPQWELMTFKTADGQTLYARMLKPPGFDPSRKYPVWMNNYGGPGSQTVRDTFLSTGGFGLDGELHRRGFILFAVDNRGTGARGREWKKVTYQSLGHWETHDQNEGARFLATLPYVDAGRIGMQGHSYGGYMALMCILLGDGLFKAAIAGAPVTHWQFYDSIYTERYMRRPAENPSGYNDSAPLTHAGKLKGKLLIAHGTADDNVHFQNSCRFVQELQKRGIEFEVMYYPGKHHGIEGVGRHVEKTYLEFILRNV